MAKVFVITGPSGVGKGTLIAKLLDRVPGLELSVSATTRQPREGEAGGRDYHFLTPQEFDARIEAEDFLEFATYSGNRYGTLRSEVRKRLDAGRSVVETTGELVITAPMPSMPVGFWGDPDGQRYRESYFETYPGVWRHGDWIRLTASGGAVIEGRSDSTLNRGGVDVNTGGSF